MAISMLLHLHKIWPFSPSKPDDLRISSKLVHNLAVPDSTKRFVFAVREPQSDSVVYILVAQNLSEQSALDAESLIREVKPNIVVAQASNSVLEDIQLEETNLGDSQAQTVPTYFGVLKECFKEKVDKARYENVAGCQVLQQIFGVGFYGHFLSAKNAARDVKSPFVLLDSPSRSTAGGVNHKNQGNSTVNNIQEIFARLSSCLIQPNGLSPGKLSAEAANTLTAVHKRIFLTDKFHISAVKSLVSSINFAPMKLDNSNSCVHPVASHSSSCSDPEFEVPSYAQSFYLLLTDLHHIFADLPIIGKALVHAQKMILNVERGERVDPEVLCEAQKFRIAVEGLRVALNDSARAPIDQRGKGSQSIDFSSLPNEEKCHVLFAEALKNQARKYGSMVAILDAGTLAGIRRHWKTNVPPEISDMAAECFTPYEDDRETNFEHHTDTKRSLADKPVVAVGAGATAILGVTALPKALPMSSLVKLVTYKVPVTVKLGFAHAPRAIAAIGKVVGVPKVFGPLKAAVSGVAGSGTKASAMKVAASAEKIRAVAHGIIASAERASLSTMQTAFYGIMKSRQGRSVGITPWAAFGFSAAACSGLLVFGDGVEYAAEAVPSATMVASLGRGLRSLHETAEIVKRSESSKLQELIKNTLYNIKMKRVQKDDFSIVQKQFA